MSEYIVNDCLEFGRPGWTVVISWWLVKSGKTKQMPILAQVH